jgi:hypothetical protein
MMSSFVAHCMLSLFVCSFPYLSCFFCCVVSFCVIVIALACFFFLSFHIFKLCVVFFVNFVHSLFEMVVLNGYSLPSAQHLYLRTFQHFTHTRICSSFKFVCTFSFASMCLFSFFFA